MEKVSAFDLNVWTPDNNFTNPTCHSFSELDILLGVTCHTFAAGTHNTSKFIGDYERGLLSHTTVGLQGSGVDFIILYDRVYDVTHYVKAIRENQEPTTDRDEGKNLDNNPQAYLTPTLNKVIMNSLGSDATELYEALFGSTEYIACLEEMFYTGLLDDQFDTFCYTLNIMMCEFVRVFYPPPPPRSSMLVPPRTPVFALSYLTSSPLSIVLLVAVIAFCSSVAPPREYPHKRR